MPRPRLALLALLVLSLAASAAADDASARAAGVGTIRKEHNVDVGGGRLAVRLTVPVDLRGWRGASVGLDVWFRDDSGTLVRSVLPAWADSAGNLRATSRTTVVEKDAEGLDFVVWVPYGAFPARSSGAYRVEVRAVVSLRAPYPGAQGTALAEGSTTFQVEG